MFFMTKFACFCLSVVCNKHCFEEYHTISNYGMQGVGIRYWQEQGSVTCVNQKGKWVASFVCFNFKTVLVASSDRFFSPLQAVDQGLCYKEKSLIL